MKEIFGFKQTALVREGLEVYQALILRWIVESGRKGFYVDAIFKDLPIIKRDFTMVMLIIAEFEEKGWIEYVVNQEDWYVTINKFECPLYSNREEDWVWFWETFGNKTGSAPSKKKFMALPQSDVDKIISTLGSYVESTLGPKEKEIPGNWKPRRKNPLTYLNQRIWDDEVSTEESEYEKMKRQAV